MFPTLSWVLEMVAKVNILKRGNLIKMEYLFEILILRIMGILKSTQILINTDQNQTPQEELRNEENLSLYQSGVINENIRHTYIR